MPEPENSVSGPDWGTDLIERRATVRYSIGRDGLCFSTVAGRTESVLAWLRNVSHAGLGLRSERRFEPGTHLVVEWHEGDTSSFNLARVIHVTHTEGRTWFHGCALVGRLSQDQLQDLIDVLSPAD
jgi:hypothetical protein